MIELLEQFLLEAWTIRPDKREFHIFDDLPHYLDVNEEQVKKFWIFRTEG